MVLARKKKVWKKLLRQCYFKFPTFSLINSSIVASNAFHSDRHEHYYEAHILKKIFKAVELEWMLAHEYILNQKEVWNHIVGSKVTAAMLSGGLANWVFFQGMNGLLPTGLSHKVIFAQVAMTYSVELLLCLLVGMVIGHALLNSGGYPHSTVILLVQIANLVIKYTKGC